MKHPSLLFSLPADIFCRVCILGIWRHFPNRIPSGICRMRRNSIGRRHRERLCSDGFDIFSEKAFRFPQMLESRNPCRAVRGGKSERKFSLPPVPRMLRIPQRNRILRSFTGQEAGQIRREAEVRPAAKPAAAAAKVSRI